MSMIINLMLICQTIKHICNTGWNTIRQSKIGSKWNWDSNIQTKLNLQPIHLRHSKEEKKENRIEERERKKTHNKFDINARQISVLIHSNVCPYFIRWQNKAMAKNKTSGCQRWEKKNKSPNVIWQFLWLFIFSLLAYQLFNSSSTIVVGTCNA